MRQFVRDLARDTASFGAVVCFVALVTLWADAVGWGGSF